MRYEEPERRERTGTGAPGQPIRGSSHAYPSRVAMTVAACVLLVAALFPPSATPSRHPSGAVPARPVANTFAAFSDDNLWKAIVASGRVAVVGLKKPGEARGVWRQRILLSRDQWRQAREAILARPGVTLVSADKVLPLLTVRVADRGTLPRLRRMPNVDYLEPLSVGPSVESGSGCDLTTYTGARPLDSAGNLLPWNFSYHSIPQAWSSANGSGVTVGVVDTGVWGSQTLLQPWQFGYNGFNSGRTVVNAVSPPSDWSILQTKTPWDTCGHGTRTAGTIAAPRTGTLNIVGVAWNANLVTMRTLDGVIIGGFPSLDRFSVRDGIEQAWQLGARIINLSIGNVVSFQAIEDEIRLHADTTLFVGAAGTDGCRGGTSPNIGVIYPAAMPEVVAVTGVHADGTLHPTTCWGPEVALAVVLDTVPAPGRYPGEVVEYGGSSDAAAVVSGIAALVWSRFPTFTAPQVRQRLLLSAKPYPAVDCSFWAWPGPVLEQGCYWGYGSPDAYAAVAGFPTPNVLGLLAADALSVLRLAGLRPIVVSSVDTLCNNIGYVINQYPHAGILVSPGSNITITVAVKPPNPCP